MFGAKKKSIVHIGKNAIQIYVDGASTPIILKLEPDTIQNLEKVNTEWLVKRVGDLIKRRQIGGLSAILVLADDLTFAKNIVAKNEETKSKDIQAFMDEVPFAPSTLIKKEYRLGEQLFVVATNKKLIMELGTALTALGMEVKSVLPEIAVGKTLVNPTGIKPLFKNTTLIKQGSILQEKIKEKPKEKIKEKPAKPKTDVKKVETPQSTAAVEKQKTAAPSKGGRDNKRLTILIIVFGALCVVGVVFYLFKDKIMGTEEAPFISPEQTAEQPGEQAAIEETAIPEEPAEEAEEEAPAPTPTEEVKRGELSVQVLNGTGTTGLAGKIKDDLESLEYDGVDVGNADNTGYEETTITVTAEMPETVINELKAYFSESFEKVFASVLSEEKSAEAEYDISVITGKLLTK
jgi:hypothetical protein